jgi:hypothetical protein
MSSPRRAIPLASLALALLAGALTPGAAHAGPPWISVELPANPFDATTRGALAVVHLYHHGDATAWPLDARAIGTVDGQRRTVRLETRPGSAAGLVVVRGTLPKGDGWVLVLTMQSSPTARASALVALDRRGDVAALRVPVDTIENGRWVTPREARSAEVDAMLRMATAESRVAESGPGGRELAIAGVGLAVLIPLGLRRRT